MAKQKVNISLDDDLLVQIDSYAKKNYMNRSAAISLATTMFLNQTKATEALVLISDAMTKILDTGEVSPDVMEQLEFVQKLTETLSGH